ncbi:MAG TPA: tetratricopeptide repeat protein [Rhizomicrobium sp.]|nr:tetratricopeptide repeat protein [Rhizomicrobium sp.]
MSAQPKSVVASEEVRAKFRQAVADENGGRLAEAERLYEEVLALQPSFVDALHRLAGLALQTRRTERGAALIAQAISISPGVAQAHANLGYALATLGRHDEALASYDTAIGLNPEFADAHYSRGIVLDQLKRLEEALASFEAAIRLKPGHAAAHTNRGIVLYDLKRFEEALASYDAAIAHGPEDANAHYNRGNALAALKRHEEALASFDAALALKPDHIVALNNRGVSLTELKRHKEAVASLDRAIACEPRYLEAHNNRGIALNDMKRYGEALAAFDAALALAPNFASAHYGRAVTLNEMKRSAEALESYSRALALDPGSPFLLGKLVHMKMTLCDWCSFTADVEALVEGVGAGKKVTPPFQLLAAVDDPALHRKAAQIYALESVPLGKALPPIAKRPKRHRIRIAYFSADFHDHATAVLMAELFERHDRARFELSAFSFGPDRDDPMRRRLVRSFDRFLDVRARSDREVAMLAREREIDIAIDLKGYTGDERHAIFAYRAAPIQASYLGYPGTMGAPFMDYLIADPTLVPESDRALYAEKIATLPCSYQPNDTKRVISEKKFTRAELGLPRTGFVFCCFNNSFKIVPETFASWMRILAAVEGSVLWLLEDNDIARANLVKEAAALGIDADRLVFAPRLPLSEHFARHRAADLFLDTLPYGAHTTASDALWAGLPVVTLKGASFASRVAASLLKAVGMPEMIAATRADYEGLAIALARDPERLGALKAKLVANKRVMPLFDIQRFTRDIEALYAAMYDRYQSDLPPEHISLRA